MTKHLYQILWIVYVASLLLVSCGDNRDRRKRLERLDELDQSTTGNNTHSPQKRNIRKSNQSSTGSGCYDLIFIHFDIASVIENDPSANATLTLDNGLSYQASDDDDDLPINIWSDDCIGGYLSFTYSYTYQDNTFTDARNTLRGRVYIDRKHQHYDITCWSDGSNISVQGYR